MNDEDYTLNCICFVCALSCSAILHFTLLIYIYYIYVYMLYVCMKGITIEYLSVMSPYRLTTH